ncbi:MAG TPA: glutathione transferase GstA [Caulobacteraceae bacterium]|nr:glutathione transferase GstA [Caulobacteraceae bacterium]
MKLYYAPGACSLAPHIVAREAGVPLELVKVDLQRHQIADTGASYTALNPKNSVPAIQLDDGQVLTEAAALVQWVAEQGSEPGLLPASGLERFRVIEWLNFVSTELHKGLGPLWRRPDAAARAAIIERLNTRFDLVEARLAEHEYVAADRFTVADAYTFTVLSWAGPLEVDLSAYPKLQAYLQRIAARPAVQEALAAEGLLNG